MSRAYYSDTIQNFVCSPLQGIIGGLAQQSRSALEPTQTDAWSEEIRILQKILQSYEGKIYFEYSIPRMGERIDVLLLIEAAIFVLEFKVGEKNFNSYAVDQVWDYALDLKNFHQTSHDCFIAPVLVATKARHSTAIISQTHHYDKLLSPILCNEALLHEVISGVLTYVEGEKIDVTEWEQGRYEPTPTIIEAATALYNRHSVQEITRKDASAQKFDRTSDAISDIIRLSKAKSQKSICFVTGVPGAGKTLVGLDIATQNFDADNELYSVYLSGNGPLVRILREALVRDRVRREKQRGKRVIKKTVMSTVKTFIQNVHNFRDDCLVDPSAPREHVALFDEAQRAWNLEQTAKFMRQKKNSPHFNQSEPEFLISCMDRHTDWAVVVCLVGGGQEINTGEAGIGEWIEALDRSFRSWQIYMPTRLTDSEYGLEKILANTSLRSRIHPNDELHLSVSMRAFRAENVSLLIKQLLDVDLNEAKITFTKLRNKYPIVITRDLSKAKSWLKSQARGSERYGIIVSSQAERLKPHAIDVKSPVNPIHWFLEDKDDVRSSYYLEDVVTEFDIQGLELDWTCVAWDGDFRFSPEGWGHWSFVGKKWNRINKLARQIYQKNAYRVLLTRARQGMVIVVPPGSTDDQTRKPDFYDPTFEYLKRIGFPEI